MPSSSPRLEKLNRRKDQLGARITNLENRRAHTRSQQDTRKKVLVGSFFQRKFAHDGEWEKLIRLIDPFLVRPYERALFGLPEVSGNDIDVAQLCSDLDLPLKGTILIGAFFMEQYKNDHDALLRMIDPFLHRRIDRKLFGLETDDSHQELLPF